MTERVGILLLVGAIALAGCRSTRKKEAPKAADGKPSSEFVKKPDPKWNPPTPGDDKFDWIRMTSGEWLKGEITTMRDGTLEFDSDEFDDMKVDWTDVAFVRSPNAMSIMMGNMQEKHGTLLVKDGKASMQLTDGTVETFSREDIVSIVPGGTGALAYWSGTLSFGLTARSGNTDQSDLQLRALARMRSPLNRLVFEYLGNYGTVSDVQTVNNHRFDSRWDRFVSRRYFITPISLDFFRDKFQNTEARITPAVGFGYHIFDKHLDKKTYDWDIAPFIGYRYTKFFSGVTSESTTATGGFTTMFNWDITKKSELTLKYNVAIGIPDTTDTNQHAELIFSHDLWKDLDIDITLIWDRVGDPQEDADGNTPEPDDFRITVGIGWDW